MLSVVLGMVLAAVAPEVTDTSPKVTVNGYASVKTPPNIAHLSYEMLAKARQATTR